MATTRLEYDDDSDSDGSPQLKLRRIDPRAVWLAKHRATGNHPVLKVPRTNLWSESDYSDEYDLSSDNTANMVDSDDSGDDSELGESEQGLEDMELGIDVSVWSKSASHSLLTAYQTLDHADDQQDWASDVRMDSSALIAQFRMLGLKNCKDILWGPLGSFFSVQRWTASNSPDHLAYTSLRLVCVSRSAAVSLGNVRLFPSQSHGQGQGEAQELQQLAGRLIQKNRQQAKANVQAQMELFRRMQSRQKELKERQKQMLEQQTRTQEIEKRRLAEPASLAEKKAATPDTKQVAVKTEAQAPPATPSTATTATTVSVPAATTIPAAVSTVATAATAQPPKAVAVKMELSTVPVKPELSTQPAITPTPTIPPATATVTATATVANMPNTASITNSHKSTRNSDASTTTAEASEKPSDSSSSPPDKAGGVKPEGGISGADALLALASAATLPSAAANVTTDTATARTRKRLRSPGPKSPPVPKKRKQFPSPKLKSPSKTRGSPTRKSTRRSSRSRRI